MSGSRTAWSAIRATSNSAKPFLRTGEIASFASFTKSTSSFSPVFFCLFNLLLMVHLLHLELLRQTSRTVSELDGVRQFRSVSQFSSSQCFRSRCVVSLAPVTERAQSVRSRPKYEI
jgi:hypothetical protein